MDSDDASDWRLQVEAALQVMVSGLTKENRAGGLNSTLRVCDVCGQSFDTLDQADVFHHGPELHPPRSVPHLLGKPEP